VYPVVDHPINRMVPQSLRAGLAVASEPHSKCIRGQGDTVQNLARGRLARAFLGPARSRRGSSCHLWQAIRAPTLGNSFRGPTDPAWQPENQLKKLASSCDPLRQRSSEHSRVDCNQCIQYRGEQSIVVRLPRARRAATSASPILACKRPL